MENKINIGIDFYRELKSLIKEDTQGHGF